MRRIAQCNHVWLPPAYALILEAPPFFLRSFSGRVRKVLLPPFDGVDGVLCQLLHLRQGRRPQWPPVQVAKLHRPICADESMLIAGIWHWAAEHLAVCTRSHY